MRLENNRLTWERVGRINKRKYREKEGKTKKMGVFLTVILTLLIVYFNPTIVRTKNANAENKSLLSVKGEVNRIISQKDVTKNNIDREFISTTQVLEVIINKGSHTGEKVVVINNYNKDMPYNYLLQKGDEVLLSVSEDGRGKLIGEKENGIMVKGHIYEFARGKYLLYLIIIFVIIVGVIGGIKGLKSLLTLFLIIVGMVKILPMFILRGYDPIISSVAISAVIVLLISPILSGVNKKTLASIIGTLSGVGISAIIAINVGRLSKLTGIMNEEIQMFMSIPQNTEFYYRGLIFAGIIIGALGVIMNVSMNMSLSMNKVLEENPRISSKELWKSGINIGRDIIGTVSSILILAYAGACIQLIVMLSTWHMSFMEIINREVIAVEIIRAMAGSIGFIFTIPITALMVLLLNKQFN